MDVRPTSRITAPIGPNQISFSLTTDSGDSKDEPRKDVPPPVTTIIHLEKDGWRSWAVCFAACFVQALIIGVMHSFGVFYVAFIEDFQCGKGEAAWVGAIAYGLTLFCGILCSPLIHRYGHQVISVIGCVMCCVSLLATSFVHDIRLTFLTFSLLYGLGSSFSYTATVTLIGSFFNKYITTATGITMAGSSIGTLIMNPTAQALVSSHGWRTAFQILAGTTLLALGLSWLFKIPDSMDHTKLQEKKSFRQTFREFEMCSRKRYVVWVVAVSFIQFGYYIPYVHMVPYAIGNGILPETASILVMILGASTAIGRIIFGRVIDNPRINKLYIIQCCCILIGAGSLILPLLHSIPSLVAYVIIAGLLDGGYVVTLLLLTNLYAGCKEENFVLGWGILVTICAVPYTLGAPIAGWLVDATGQYNTAFQLAGVIIIIGGLILTAITVLEKYSPIEKELSSQLPSMDIERGEAPILPSIEVLTVMSNSIQDVNISTASFDSIVVLGVKTSKQRNHESLLPSDIAISHDVTEPIDETKPSRFHSPTVLTHPATGKLIPSTRIPRQRTVSVGDQDIRPKRIDANAHIKDGVILDIRDVINPFSRDIIVSCYSALDLADHNISITNSGFY